MIWKQFYELVRKMPYFSESRLPPSIHSPTLRNQFVRWTKEKRILRIKNGLYTLPEEDRKVGLSLLVVSNILYSPSYVSLEYMLSEYELIPEKVTQVTAICRKKTMKFNNPTRSICVQKFTAEIFFWVCEQKR